MLNMCMAVWMGGSDAREGTLIQDFLAFSLWDFIIIIQWVGYKYVLL